MHSMLIIAFKEIKDGFSNKWVVTIAVLLALFAIGLSYLGSMSVDKAETNPLAIIIVNLASLTIFLLPLIALLLSYDTIIGEIEKGTINSLLLYPLTRIQLIISKYIGQLFILIILTIIIYSISGGIIYYKCHSLKAINLWFPYIKFILTSILLGADFLAIGYLLSALGKDRAVITGLVVIVWLLFVLIYDLSILLILIGDKGKHITIDILNLLLIFNPVDAFRIINLSGDIINVPGLIGILNISTLRTSFLLISLFVWIFVPLSITNFIVNRKSL